ncbi:hypothetical protein FRAHR75_80078 [Frankia sp. Hr75.2]|nr:hypothetical protein FRAHR75_80078 [Frankia sp. Hr75.2]
MRQSLAVAGGEQIGAVGAQLIEREGLQVLLDRFDPLDEGLVATVRFARRGQQTHGALDTQCGREYERPVVGDGELVPGSCRRGASRRRVRLGVGRFNRVGGQTRGATDGERGRDGVGQTGDIQAVGVVSDPVDGLLQHGETAVLLRRRAGETLRTFQPVTSHPRLGRIRRQSQVVRAAGQSDTRRSRVRRSRRGAGRRRAGRTITRRLAVIRTASDQQNTRNDKHRS